jgi:hypothetical protein
MTAYYVVEEEDSFFPDDFGNDDAPKKMPEAPTGLMATLNPGESGSPTSSRSPLTS